MVDTRCEPLVRYFQQLAEPTACRLIRTAASGHVAAGQVPCDSPAQFIAERLSIVAPMVTEARAHFGLWISGDGERLFAVDERGERIAPERLFLLLATFACRDQTNTTLLWEADANNDPRCDCIGGARLLRTHGTRQAVCEQMLASEALLGGGSEGRIWFSGEPPTADALSALSLLLAALSASDRSLSAALDAVDPDMA